MIKNLPANAGATGDVGWIPGSGRSPGAGNDKPLQYSCLGNPMNKGVWQATVHGVTESRTRLSTCARSLPCDFLSFFHSSLKMSKQFLIQGHADTAIGLIWSACNCQPGPDSRVKEHNSWKSQLPHYYIDGETESQRAQCPPVVRWAAKGFAWTLARSSLPVFWDNLLPSLLLCWGWYCPRRLEGSLLTE